MKINQKKLKRQQRVIQRWKDNRAKGTLEAVTGFGKTYVAILVIKEMNQKRPDRDATVIVPTLYLKKQWEIHIKTHKLKNVTVMVVNTAVKAQFTTDLLVLDEVHNYASKTFKSIFRVCKYKFLLGLTATMERLDNRHIILESYCPIIDTVTMEEAIENDYVSRFVVINYGIEMDEKDSKYYKDIGDKFGKFFGWFSHNWDTAMGCLTDSAYRKQYADKIGEDPDKVFIFALNWNKNMQLRKKFLYFAPSKRKAAKELIKTFRVPAITFSESVEFSESLTEDLKVISRSYNSKMRKKERMAAIESYADPKSKVRVINTAKALDEGFDVPGTEMAIICSGNSSPRQDLQRTGRAIRYMEGKLGIIINLYIKGTQDEKWLQKRQAKAENVVYASSIEEIKEIVNKLKQQTV